VELGEGERKISNLNEMTVGAILTAISQCSDAGISKPKMADIVNRLPWQSRYDKADWTQYVTRCADEGHITRQWDERGNPFYSFPLYRGSNLLPTLQD